MSRVIAAIPARFGSLRLPGKPLLLLDGEPLISHVVRAACAASSVQRVIVATDHADIAAAARRAGAEAVMTASALASGTDRVAAALRAINASTAPGDVVVNVQGDEPRVEPAAIDLVAETLLACPGADMSTLSAPLALADLLDPTKVKVVSARGANDAAGAGVVSDPTTAERALFFSRAPIGVERELLVRLLRRAPADESPNAADDGSSDLEPLSETGYGCRLHVGVYGFRPAALQRFVTLPPCGQR